MDSREEALGALEEILYQTGRYDCDFVLVGLCADKIRKALQAKEPEQVTIEQFDNIIEATKTYHTTMGEHIARLYPHGLIIKDGE